MQMDALFSFIDTNANEYVSLTELLAACAPDVNNDGIYNEQELALGKKTARIWVAMILAHDDMSETPILSDGVISKSCRAISVLIQFQWSPASACIAVRAIESNEPGAVY